MDLASSIHNTWKQEIIIKSIIWNTIITIFKEEKNIDITSYLVSIKLKWANILVKTNKPIINTELYLLSSKIASQSKKKIKNLWLVSRDFEIKFL